MKTIKNEILLLILMIAAVVFVAGYEHRLLQTRLLVDGMVSESVDYDAFRELKISETSLDKAITKIKKVLKEEPELRGYPYMDPIGYLTFSMMAWDYDQLKQPVIDERTFIRGIGRVAATEQYRELYAYYRAILSDLRYFPVPCMEEADISFGNSWNDLRTYGGNRTHEGTDIMASNNIRGYFPVISITDGVVEKKGWLEQGGYRIGVRSETGGYFYYAHLYSYAPGLEVGDPVIAGQLLGFMGDSGYGNEGTIGQFAVHLHLGIYVNQTNEMSVNPYWILKILEKNRISAAGDYNPG